MRPTAFADIVAVCCVIVLCLAVAIGHAEDNRLSGLPYFTDADTVEIAGERVRLAGIDAPEMDQICLDKDGKDWRCGVAAREALVSFSADRSWTCALEVRPDRYGRRVGRCEVADHIPHAPHWIDVQAWLVRSGWALDWPKYSHRRYAREQEQARAAGLGLWSGAFHAPWDWRHRTCDTEILGARSVPVDARAKLCR